MKKYYEILEVNPKASIEIIEKAYKVLTRKYHPDLYEGEKKIYAEQKMRDINEAYKILSDDFLREQYDSELKKEQEYNNDIYRNKDKDNSPRKSIFKKKMQERNDGLKAQKSEIGTYRGLLGITKELYKNRPKFKNIKDLQREDYIAAGITAVIMIVILVALWFIPFTNSFIKDMLPFLK